MKYFTLIALAGFLLLTFAPMAQAVEWLPLVPCGVKGDPARSAECTRCDLLKLLKNLIDMVLFGITAPIATLLFVISGIMVVAAGANPALIGRARGIAINTFYALLIIGGSWLIVNTLLRSFATDNIATDWWKLTCKATVPRGATPPPTVSPTPPTGGVPGQQQAQAILAAGISLSTSADCGAPNHAQGTIQAIAGGKYPPVCSPACDCKAGGTNGTTTVDPAILDDILALKSGGFSFTVTSLTTGKHSSNSTHYRGTGADVAISGTDPAKWQQAVRFLQGRGRRAFCETVDGKADATCTIPPTDHIHWDK